MFGKGLTLSEAVLITEQRDLELRCAPYLDSIEVKNRQIAILNKIKSDIKAASFVLFAECCIMLEICPAVKAEMILEQIEIREKQRDEIYKNAYKDLDTDAYAYFLKKEKELK